MLRPSPLVILLLLLGHAAARRGKGSGGDSDSGGSDDSGGDDGSSNGGGSMSGSGGSSSRRPPCGWAERQKAFSLPGLYYNGTITVRHHLTGNTVWADEGHGPNKCQNDDQSPKEYTYPAMLLIAPTGNESDTNPIHWALRAYQPANQYSYKGDGEVDFLQRWVHLRSSDFVLSNNTRLYDYPYSPYSRLRYHETDATDLELKTRVYWPTKVTSQGSGIYSAHAEYKQPPPRINVDDYRNTASWKPGVYSSQYVTLSDVCTWNLKSVNGTYGAGPGLSRIPQGNTNWDTTTPTLWLTEGAKLDMADIGADSMTLTLNNSLSSSIPRMGEREGGCSSKDYEPFELSDFHSSQSADNNASDVKLWNLTLSIGISFKGSLVAENSTKIRGLDNEKLLFETMYNLTDGKASRNTTGENYGMALRTHVEGLLALAICTILFLVV